MGTAGKFVLLSLDTESGEELAADIYYVCSHCGPSRMRLRFTEDGAPGTLVPHIASMKPGEQMCSHFVLHMSHYLTSEFLELD